MYTLNEKQKELLNQALPSWAIKPHPTKPHMSSIHPMAVIDRLNEVFGVAGWSFFTEFISCEKEIQMVKDNSPGATQGAKKERVVYVSAVHGTLKIGDITIEQFGGSTNDDKGDALKGGATDALTKIASYLGIGASIYKNQGNVENDPDKVVNTPPQVPAGGRR